jgi:energy-coupling factor transporter ATP-binding protein EcfA2
MLEARDLWVNPPGAREPVVRGASLRIARGEWVALSGPNGCGKTSLLMALAGLWPAVRGTLTWDGKPLGVDPRQRADHGVAVILQDPSCQILQATVADELAFAARNLGRPEQETRRRVMQWSARLGLDAELERAPGTLSAGRQQMVLFGASLVAAPALLLADEPTAHLDGDGRDRVLEALAEELARGLAVLWATQDSSEIGLAHRTIRLGDRGGPPPGVETRTSINGAIAARVRVVPSPASVGPRLALDEPLEISVPCSGVVALTGPNGAGKSVLLNAVGGLEPLDQVGVEWCHQGSHPPIQSLQYPELQIFEEVVADELVFAAVARGLSRVDALDRARAALTALDLDPDRILARRTWSLAAGEKRLIEVVGALIAPASLVLLDEPTAGLDAVRRSALARLALQRAASGPIMIATQDVPWATEVGASIVRLGVRRTQKTRQLTTEK